MRRILAGFALLGLLAATAAADELGDLVARFRREKDRPYAERMATVQAVAALGTEKAARFLLGVIEEDADTSVRLNTIHQVARLPHPIVFQRLVGWVRDGETSLASTALHAICWNREEALPADLLATILAGRDQGMRANVVRYLARHADERFLPEAKRFLAEFPTGVTSLTSILVQAATPATAAILLRVYDDTRRYDREQVAGMFAAAKPEVRAVLVEGLRSPDRALVLGAAVLCARAGVKEAEAALVAAIAPKDTERHAVLLESLGAIGATSAEARAALLSALEAPATAVRVAGVRAARGMPFREAVLPLVEVLEGARDRLLAAETAVTLERVTGQQYGSRADLWRRWWAEHGEGFDLGAVPPPAADHVPQTLVDLAIERGTAALKRLRRPDPPWVYANHPQGTTALVVLALHAAGLDAKDPDVKAAVAWLLKAPVPDTTYDTGLVAMALEAVGGRRHRRRIAECARRLAATQNAQGLWGYPSGDGDNSNTQYAVLGLRAAARVGVKVPGRVWAAARDHFLAARGKDGGWAYPIRNPDYSSTSMTAAGVASLLICLERLEPAGDERTALQEAIEGGYAALGTLMKPEKDSLYALYGVERAGVLGGRSAMGGRAWYPPGAKRLVEEQGRDGVWTGSYDPAVDTAFAILFLKRATVPVAAAVTTR